MKPSDNEPEEMEDWMQIWQQNVEPIDELREDFMRRSRKDIRDLNAIAAIVGVGLVTLVVLAVVRASWLPLVALVIVGPWAIYNVVRTRQFANLYRSAPPLTPRGYLETMRLHLEIRRRHHAFDQSMIPLGVALPALIVAVVFFFKGINPVAIAMLVFIAGPGYAYALYSSFYKVPGELEAEQRRLAELEDDLLD